jgi:hypothetical protein
MDEHLRGLLGEKPKSLWPADASVMSDNQDSMQSSIQMNIERDGIMSIEPSSTETSEERRQQDSRNPTYKFKNDIKLRFSADMLIGGKEGRRMNTPDEECKMKEGATTLSSSDTTSYPGSDFSSNGNGNSCNGNMLSSCASSVSEGQSNNRRNGSVEVPSIDLANSVPGFALHPAGSYYIPVVTPVSQLMPFIRNYSPSGICHPISIPVNLGGPFVCMHNLHPGHSTHIKVESSRSPSNHNMHLHPK